MSGRENRWVLRWKRAGSSDIGNCGTCGTGCAPGFGRCTPKKSGWPHRADGKAVDLCNNIRVLLLAAALERLLWNPRLHFVHAICRTKSRSPTYADGGFVAVQNDAWRTVAGPRYSGHIHWWGVVFIDVRSASAALALALTWLTMVDKTRALNDRR